jgi:hypothetical protein
LTWNRTFQPDTGREPEKRKYLGRDQKGKGERKDCKLTHKE